VVLADISSHCYKTRFSDGTRESQKVGIFLSVKITEGVGSEIKSQAYERIATPGSFFQGLEKDSLHMSGSPKKESSSNDKLPQKRIHNINLLHDYIKIRI